MTTNIEELNSKIDALGSAWEQFKSANERRIDEIAKKGTADTLTIGKVDKLSDELDRVKESLDKFETKLNRPGGAAGGDNPGTNSDAVAYKKGFVNYLRKGVEDGLDELHKKAMSVGSDPDGGYLVTPEQSSQIIKTIYETSPIRQLASVVAISTDSLEFAEDRGEAEVGWVGETQSRPDTDTPQIGKRTINVHELYAQPKATQKLIDDSAVDIEAWLGAKLADAFSRKENTAFITGDGVGKPRGLLTYANGTGWGQIEQEDTGANGDFDGDDLIDLFYKLKDAYARNANWLMNRASVKIARKLKDSNTGQYLWQPGLQAGEPDLIFGRPVYKDPDMPAPNTGTLSVAVGDFKATYQIVDRFGIRVMRDPFTDKPFVKYYSTKRVGGDVINFEAVKLLKLS